MIEAEKRYGNASVTSSRSFNPSLSALKINESTSRNSSTEIFPNVSSDQSSCQRSSSFHSEPLAADSYTYLYIQMELCRPENLANWLKTRQPVELNVHQMYREILSAVEYLHSQVSYTFLLSYVMIFKLKPIF
jgi:serine/threonine protein kinase